MVVLKPDVSAQRTRRRIGEVVDQDAVERDLDSVSDRFDDVSIPLPGPFGDIEPGWTLQVVDGSGATQRIVLGIFLGVEATGIDLNLVTLVDRWVDVVAWIRAVQAREPDEHAGVVAAIGKLPVEL